MARVVTPTLLSLAGRVLSLHQPVRGYRFGADSLHLVHFAHTGRTVATLADLGAGCGVVGLALLALGAAQEGTFVERDALQAERCARNLDDNALSGHVYASDVATLQAPRRCGLVVCNPPYFEAAEGRASPDPAKRLARTGELRPFVQAAARWGAPASRICFVYPAATALRLFDALAAAGLHLSRLAWVHSRATEPARLVLVEARAAGRGGLRVEAPRIELL